MLTILSVIVLVVAGVGSYNSVSVDEEVAAINSSEQVVRVETTDNDVIVPGDLGW